MTAQYLIISASLVLSAPAVVSRLLFLAPYRIGALMYYANVVNDTFRKRAGLHSNAVELSLLGLGSGMLGFSDLHLCWAIVPAALVVVLEFWNRSLERKTLSTAYTWFDPRGTGFSSPEADMQIPGAYPSPALHPELTVQVDGPFVERLPALDLGVMVVGRRVQLDVIVGNHTILPAQVGARLRIVSSHDIEAEPLASTECHPLAPGEVVKIPVCLTAKRACGTGQVRMTVVMAGREWRIVVGYRAIIVSAAVQAATITRYAGARRAAFAWRGDMDHYDTASFQSIEGLRHTLGLGARYRVPQTMYLSSRLTLDLQATAEFYEHFGVERGQKECEEFATWLRSHADLSSDQAYPIETGEKPYAVEIGNHMHLHYGTDAGAAPENGWRRATGIGVARYPWSGTGHSSLDEQRDNALEARAWIERELGVSPVTWAMPDSTNDEFTSAAVEAAGCVVLSDSNTKHLGNVIFQPPPHHPTGTSAVELTKRYPGDPETIAHAAMIEYWMHRAHRKGIPVVFMGHQHLRLFAGYACHRFTEHVLRYALQQFGGDLWIASVSAVGRYWHRLLSPKTRVVGIEVREGKALVRNRGNDFLRAVPVDLDLQNGNRCTVIADLPAGGQVVLDASGVVDVTPMAGAA